MTSKLLVVQYGGDYREAYLRFKNGGPEYYYGQRYSVEVVRQAGKIVGEAATLVFFSDGEYDELLEDGVRAIGIGLKNQKELKKAIGKILAKLKEYQPTHIIFRTPSYPLIDWAVKSKINTVMLLADSFRNDSIVRRLKNFRLARMLNQKGVRWIGNHGISSCESLKAIGVNADKIVPWDWPHTITPMDNAPKPGIAVDTGIKLIYVGAISEAKGVVDLINAVSVLRSKSKKVSLDIYGKGDEEYCKKIASALGISDVINLRGLIPNIEIVPLMRAADIVVVPSRADYPEGFPKTINEALCSRTPIVASNHPMFSRALCSDINSVIFEAGNADALARCIDRLASDRVLYERLSLAAPETWQRLQIRIKWGDFLFNSISEDPNAQDLLYQNRLAALSTTALAN